MAIKNINTIEHISDLSRLTTLSNEYILQSLANLGQRFAPEGKSINTNDFRFKDILSINLSGDAYKGVIEYNPTLGCNFYYINLNEDKNEGLDYFTKRSTTGWYNNLDIIKIAGIDLEGITGNTYLLKKYWIKQPANECFIECTDNYYNLSFWYTGTSSEENKKYKEYSFQQYNKKDNTLNNGIRFFYVTDNYDNTNLYVYHLVKRSSTNYALNVYSAVQDEELQTQISSLLSYDSLNTSLLQQELDNYLRLQNTDNYDNFLNYLFNGTSRLFYGSGNLFNGPEVFSVHYDTNRSMYFNISDNETINEYLNYFTYDIVYQYKFALDYYYDEVYYDETSVRKALLLTITKQIAKDSGCTISSTNNFKIYLPLDYNFKYFTDTSGEANDKIYINALPVSCEYNGQYYTDYYHFKQCKILLTTTTEENKIRQYNYSAKYIDELINQSVVDRIYIESFYCECYNILPYIKDDKWYINDLETNYYSKGKDAGKPNVILYYNNEIKSNPTLLSSAYKDELTVNGFLDSWNTTYVTVKTSSIIDPNVDYTQGYMDDEITLQLKTPILNSNLTTNSKYMSLLENSLLLNIAPINTVYSGYMNTYTLVGKTIADYNTYSYVPKQILAHYIKDIESINKRISQETASTDSSERLDIFKDANTDWHKVAFSLASFDWKSSDLFKEFINKYCKELPLYTATTGLVNPSTIDEQWTAGDNTINTALQTYILKNDVETNSAYDIILSNNTWTICHRYYNEITYQKIMAYDNPVPIDVSTIKEKYGEDGLVTTLWTLTYSYVTNDTTLENQYTYIYKPIENPNNTKYSLDLNSLSSVNNLISYQIKYGTIYPEPDNSFYDQVTFNNCYISLKNQDDTTLKIYPNIVNLDALHMKSYDVFVDNNCNFTFRYSASVNYNDHTKTIEGFNQTILNSETNEYTDVKWINNINPNTNIFTPIAINNGNKEETSKTVIKYPNIESYNSYTFNCDMPLLELKEIIVNNENVLNRLNILSLDDHGKIYNSYIGTSINIENKNWLVLGSSNTNINIGNETLLDKSYINNFAKNTYFLINFDDIIQTYSTNFISYSTYNYIQASSLLTNNSFITENNQLIRNKDIVENYGPLVYTYSTCIMHNDGLTYINNTIEYTPNSYQVSYCYTHNHQSVISNAINTNNNDVIIKKQSNNWRRDIVEYNGEKNTARRYYYYSTSITSVLNIPTFDINNIENNLFEIGSNNELIYNSYIDDSYLISGFRIKMNNSKYLTLVEQDYLLDNVLNTKNFTLYNNIKGQRDNRNYDVQTNNNVISYNYYTYTYNGEVQYIKPIKYIQLNSNCFSGIYENHVILPQLSLTYWHDINNNSYYHFVIDELSQNTWKYPGKIIINSQSPVQPTVSPSPSQTQSPISSTKKPVSPTVTNTVY